MIDYPIIRWTETGAEQSAIWLSANGSPPPKRIVIADDTIKADDAYRLACEGTALLWRSDFHNAKQLLQAIARRIDAKTKDRKSKAASITQAFHQNRQAQAQRANILGMVLIPFNADHTIPLRRAPNVQQACVEAYGEVNAPYISALRELQGIIGAHEWRKKGVDIPALNGRIHPHYGVFSPIRGEYLELVANAPLPPALQQHSYAFDIGTGTGVLAAILAKRGIQHIVATDMHAAALNCANENIARLGFGKQVGIVQADLYPHGKAALIVCNPPWVPAKPSSALDAAIFDPDSRMLSGFLNGLAQHLNEQGEGWLILSDLAEHLGLRSRDALLNMIATAGLTVLGKIDTQPHHPRTADQDDPLHAARAAETTSLWRLAIK
jgi:methylase of polypeptide subunit release factors